MMIKKANKTHTQQIIQLWNEAFGDEESDILNYLAYLLDFFYIYEENGEVNAMAAVLPLACHNQNGGYIYAVATRKSAQGRGLSTNLLNHIKSLSKYSFLVLVPQNEGLFEFYQKRGFVSFSSVTTKDISVLDVTANNIACEEISTEEYYALRKDFFGNEFIEWGIETLDFAKAMYDGAFYLIKAEEKTSACFCFKDKEKLVIKEILDFDGEQLAKKIAKLFDVKCARVSYPDFGGKPSAMSCPTRENDQYFAIALD